MINLLIDTNIFIQDPKRNKMDFVVLGKLCKSGYVKLHIPTIVRNEYLTSRTSDEQLSIFSEVFTRIERIKNLDISKKDVGYLNKIRTNLNKIKSDYKIIVEKEFDAWIKNNNGKYYDIKAHHGKAVIASYFTGSAPFKKIKSREDFPDAFIYQIAIDISKKTKDLSIISNDNNFCESFKNIKTIFVYKSFEEFFKSKEIAKKLNDGFGEKYFESIINEIKNDSSSIVKYINANIIKELHSKRVSIEVWGESMDAYIGMVDETYDIQFDFPDAEYFGDGLIGLPFSCRTDVYIEYSIDRSLLVDLYREKRSISVTDSYSEYYCDIEENVEVKCNGFLSLQIKEIDVIKSEDDINIKKLIEDAENNFDSIDEIEVISL
jgi:hypothetical protein